MGLETWDMKTRDKKPPKLEKETEEENRELGWWLGEKSLNLKKSKKKKTGSLERWPGKKPLNQEKKQERKTGRGDKLLISLKKDQLEACKITGRSQILSYIVK